MGHLARFFSDIQLICGGMLIMSCGVLSLGFLEQDAVNPSWTFLTAIFLIYSVGYPIGHTAVIGLFSKSEFARLLFPFCLLALLRAKYVLLAILVPFSHTIVLSMIF